MGPIPMGKAAKRSSGVSPSARLAKRVLRVTRVPGMTASPPQMSGLQVTRARKALVMRDSKALQRK